MEALAPNPADLDERPRKWRRRAKLMLLGGGVAWVLASVFFLAGPFLTSYQPHDGGPIVFLFDFGVEDMLDALVLVGILLLLAALFCFLAEGLSRRDRAGRDSSPRE